MKIKRIITLVLAFVMLLSACACRKVESEGKGDGGNKGKDNGPAVWSETTEISREMYLYFYNGYYRYFLETNSSSLTAMGLDPAKALSAQQYSDKYTWQQYFTIQVYGQLREMVALADAARAEKMELTKEEKKDIKGQIDAYDKLAKEANMEIAPYIEEVYGKGVTKKVMEEALTVRFLANKYYNKLMEGYVYTEDECLEYYNKNSNSFVHFDYLKITVPKEDVAALEKCTDKESFVGAMRAIITKNNFLDDYERFESIIEEQVKKKQFYRGDYDKNSDFCKWVVKEGRKPYDIYKKTESTGNVTVCMILPTTDPGAVNEIVYRDDMPLKNLKYMVFEDGEGTTGKVKAESIYKNWQENPTAERFEELAVKYDGGVAEDVVKGQFADEAVEAWVFSEDRKVGDTSIIEVDGGAYLFYMMEDGDPSWITDVKAALLNEEYSADLDSLMKKYPTEYDGDFIYTVVEVKINTESNS